MNIDPGGFGPPARVPVEPDLLAAVAGFDSGEPWPDGARLWRSADGRTWVSVDLDDGDPREPYVQITLAGADAQERAAKVIRALSGGGPGA